MKMPNAVKICNSVGTYTRCNICPIYSVCVKDYNSTEEFEKAVEKAATDYLKGMDNEKGKVF